MTDDNFTDPEDPEPAAPEPSQLMHCYFDENNAITVITPVGDDKLVFCGREDGTVPVHEIKTGKQVTELEVLSAAIQQIEWNSATPLLVIMDASSRCRATRLPVKLQGPVFTPRGTHVILNTRTTLAVSQIFIGPDGHADAVSRASSLGGIKEIIELTRSTVIFLTRSGWICSLNLKTSLKSSRTQATFILLLSGAFTATCSRWWPRTQ